MKTASVVLAAALLPLLVQGQEFKLPASLDRLSARAEESVDVTLDGAMLKLAGRFLSDHDPDDAGMKKVVAGLESISVRSYRFFREGEYTAADLDAVRAELRSPEWSRIVGVRTRNHNEDADIYFKNGANGKLGGIVILATEPRELTVVSIIGTLDPEQLANLSGEFGIPKLEIGSKPKGGWL
jgi:hypothetical protein